MILVSDPKTTFGLLRKPLNHLTLRTYAQGRKLYSPIEHVLLLKYVRTQYIARYIIPLYRNSLTLITLVILEILWTRISIITFETNPYTLLYIQIGFIKKYLYFFFSKVKASFSRVFVGVSVALRETIFLGNVCVSIWCRYIHFYEVYTYIGCTKSSMVSAMVIAIS